MRAHTRQGVGAAQHSRAHILAHVSTQIVNRSGRSVVMTVSGLDRWQTKKKKISLSVLSTSRKSLSVESLI